MALPLDIRTCVPYNVSNPISSENGRLHPITSMTTFVQLQDLTFPAKLFLDVYLVR